MKLYFPDMYVNRMEGRGGGAEGVSIGPLRTLYA